MWTGTAIVAVVVGISFTFAGHGLFYATLGFTGFLAGFVVGFGLLCGLTSSAMYASIAGVVGGIAGALLLLRMEKLGVLLCGAAGGVAIYMYFNGFFLAKL